MMKARILVAALTLLAMNAQAKLVTVIASGALYAQFSDPQGLLPFTESDIARAFTLTVTFDDTASRDIAPDDSTLGVYPDTIVDMQLRIGTVALSPWSTRNLVIANDRDNGQGEFQDFWLATTLAEPEPLGDAGETRQASFALIFVGWATSAPVPKLDSDNLVAPVPDGYFFPGEPQPWPLMAIDYSIDDYAGQTSLGSRARFQGAVGEIHSTVSEVPLPASSWLFPAAFAAAGLRARRRR